MVAIGLKNFGYMRPLLYQRLMAVGVVILLATALLAGSGTPLPRGGGASLISRQLPRADTLVVFEPAAGPVLSNQLPPYDLQGPTDVVALGYRLNADKFGEAHWPALYKLWLRESHWNPAARNPLSGACGIPQALPCRKMTDTSTEGQIRWGLDYIQHRYGTPTEAWQFWQRHRWY